MIGIIFLLSGLPSLSIDKSEINVGRVEFWVRSINTSLLSWRIKWVWGCVSKCMGYHTPILEYNSIVWPSRFLKNNALLSARGWSSANEKYNVSVSYNS